MSTDFSLKDRAFNSTILKTSIAIKLTGTRLISNLICIRQIKFYSFDVHGICGTLNYLLRASP